MDAALDRFSGVASGYARYRPLYPVKLFADILSLTEARICAWDAGTGNGQVAQVLAESFDTVIATDISAAQIAQAQTRPGIQYRVCRAEESGIVAHTVNLVTVAQAIHWFDLDRFVTEVSRVCTPGAILAVWGYGLLEAGPKPDRLIRLLYDDILKGFWDPHRKLVDREYSDLQFPFEEQDSGFYSIEKPHSAESLLGYLRTWSAVAKYIKQHGIDPVDQVAEDLKSALGNQEVLTRTPVFLRVWRVNT